MPGTNHRLPRPLRKGWETIPPVQPETYKNDVIPKPRAFPSGARDLARATHNLATGTTKATAQQCRSPPNPYSVILSAVADSHRESVAESKLRRLAGV